MMDNSQSLSDNAVNSEDIKSEQVFEAKVETPIEVKKEEVKETIAPKERNDKQVPLHELYKERNRRKVAEEELLRLRSRVDELDSKVSKQSQSQEDEELVSEAEKELGIDKDAARKLLRLQRKVAEGVAPKNTQPSPINDPVLQAMDGFKKRASESSQDYEDWNDMIPAMQSVMAKEIEQNGLGAYNKSPDYYYSKALRAKNEQSNKVRKEDAIEKANVSELATVETGSSSNKSGSTSKLNQSIFDANRADPVWVRENSEEIKQLWRQGKLK